MYAKALTGARMTKKGTEGSKRAKSKPSKKKKRADETPVRKFNKSEQKEILTKAGELMPVTVIASCLGMKPREFRKSIAADPELGEEYLKALGQAKYDLMGEARLKAVSSRSPVLMIFLLKSLCGLREADAVADDAEDKAKAIREGLDRMNGVLLKFQAPDGSFDPARAEKA